jgi:transposase InsO family protein
MDFVADQPADGRRFRSLTVVDIYTRECLAIKSEQSLKGEDVVLALNRIKLQRAVPKFLYCDNANEFHSQAMDLWAYQNGVRMAFSRPGKLTDNAFVESFNGTFRAECLNAHWFTSLTEENLITLCDRCHRRTHLRQPRCGAVSRAFGSGYGKPPSTSLGNENNGHPRGEGVQSELNKLKI